MFDLLKTLFGTADYVSRTDTTPDGPDPDPNDLWLFTDLDALETYTRRGSLRPLEHDVHFEVMRGGPWLPDELEYKAEIRRLLKQGVIADKGTYWFRSPHPTVYRALRDGSFSVAGKTYRFRADDEVVFRCRMERDEAGEDPGPVLVGRLRPADRAVPCGEMSSAMKGMGKRRGGMGTR